MDYEIINGKRKDSEIYYVRDSNLIFVKKKNSADIVYLDCYFKKCCAKGKIEKDNKYHEDPKIPHSNHDISVNSLLAMFEFYNELRQKCSTFGKSLKIIFDETYMK